MDSDSRTQEYKARSLYIHCGASDDQQLLQARKRFWKCQGIPHTPTDKFDDHEEQDQEQEQEFDIKKNKRRPSSGKPRSIGVAAADVGPDAMTEIQTADHERIATSVRERRKRQLQERASELTAKAAAEAPPKGLPDNVMEKLDEDESRKRELLETFYHSQWLRYVEMGRAAQIPIALGERKLGKFVSLGSGISAK